MYLVNILYLISELKSIESSERVAKDTGIPKSTFSDWKSGRSKPKIAKLKILAGYFDVAVDELISATDETGSEEGRE